MRVNLDDEYLFVEPLAATLNGVPADCVFNGGTYALFELTFIIVVKWVFANEVIFRLKQLNIRPE